jgi:type III secretory pathway component EscT
MKSKQTVIIYYFYRGKSTTLIELLYTNYNSVENYCIIERQNNGKKNTTIDF